jgi:membrane carboxypeptidase/penicillin-binding protein PbpC
LEARTRQQLAFRAPHLSEYLLANRREQELHSTLNLPLQRLLEQLVSQFVAERSPQGVHNAVALLVDSRDQSVKALVGSADYFSPSIRGQVNGVQARRSPGSTLEPFLYGLALDQGVIQPMSIIKDAATAFGNLQLENFDGKFAGPLTAQDALVRSRNVPAVCLASQISQPSLHGFLQRAGIQRLREDEFYGLGLALGGGELTPAELASLYLLLAGDGRLRNLRYTTDEPASVGAPLLSQQASFMVRDMLKHNPRPDGLPPDRRGRNWPVMVDRKTGKAACPPYDPATTDQQIFEFWPSDLQRLFAAAGLPRRSPPDSLSDCQTALSSNQQDAPRITSPLTQVTYSLRLSQPTESIALTANAASDARRLYWFAGQTLRGQSPRKAP